MAEPLAAPEPTALPPDPITQAGHRVASLAGEAAKEAAERRLRSFVKSYVPRVLHPLIPGERGTVAGNAKRAVSRWFWGLVGSVVFSLVFFAVVAAVLAGTALIVIWALITS